jgi:hypothetical protein
MAPMLVSAARQVRQFICGLHGHDALLHFDQRHVSLLCAACGHESPGWDLPGEAAVPSSATGKKGANPAWSAGRATPRTEGAAA